MSGHAKERKICLMGYRSVGKSSLVIQFVEKQFVDNYEPTIENTFQKSLKVAGQDYNLQLVDTAGQDEHMIMHDHYVMNVDGYIIVYSVNSERSFQVAKNIYDRLKDRKGELKVPVVLVANKKDLRMESTHTHIRLEVEPSDDDNDEEEWLVFSPRCSKVVPTEEGKKLADSWKAPFLEASAKENSSVSDIFEKIINVIQQQENGGQPNKSSCAVS